MATKPKHISGPAAELISTQDAINFLREGSNAQSGVIDGLVTVCREWLEAETSRNFGISSFEFSLEGFNDFTFPRSPVDIDSVMITYNDDQSLPGSNYTIIDQEEPAGLEFKGTLPTLDSDLKYPVKVSFDAGYTLATVPERALTAMKLLLAHYYGSRDPGNGKIDYSIPIPNRIRLFTDSLKPKRFL